MPAVAPGHLPAYGPWVKAPLPSQHSGARIEVVEKDERAKPGPSLSLRTTETARIEEAPAPPIREYRVQAEGETWYRVSADPFERAEVGDSPGICR